MKPAWKISALALVVALLIPATSWAQPEVELRAFAPPEWDEDPKNKETIPPKFRAVVKEAPAGLGEDKFTLKQIDLKEPVSVKAESVVGYKESDEPMAMVILVQGQARWMGNDEYTDIDDDNYSEGAWKGVPPAIDALAQAGPPGSVGALLVYHDTVEVRAPMGDVSKLTGSALGPQESFKQTMFRSLVAGLKKAATLLSEQTGKRRILVVIGDGEGQKDDISGDIRNAKKQLEELEVEVFTIQYYAKPTDDPVGQANMKQLGELGNAQSVATRENFATTAESFVTLIGNRYYVDFPGWNEKAELYFSHDGTAHEFLVQVGDEELEPLSGAVTTLNWKVPSKGGGGSLWWLWLIIILLLLIVGVVLFLKWRAGREEVYQPEEPMMVDEAPPPAPEPAPMKTMMLGVGGNDEGFPIVGWVVPLSGPNQYQTFKLRQGVTKLGSGAEADVIIQDQFMSTTHAEIVCSPAGFLLKDGGSTNGTYVNEKRVDTHDLVDNDVFSMGKTDFKFKSIN